MNSRGTASATAIRLLVVLSALLVTPGCAGLPRAFQTHSMPVFDAERVEKIGEPIAVIMVDPRKVQAVALGDGRTVQAMPVFLERRRNGEVTWSSLRNAATISQADDPRSPEKSRVYLIGSSTSGGTQSPVSEDALTSMSLTSTPAQELAARETAFLASLDRSDFRSADVLVVCLPKSIRETATARVQCLQPGGKYVLALEPARDSVKSPPAEFPFRIERRNGVLGAVSGVAFLLTFVWLNAK